MLKTENITKAFGSLEVLKGVNFDIKKGEVISIVGSSGAGKSTFLHIIGTLDQPDAGAITIDDTDVTALKGSKLAAFRNSHIGFVFQFHNLLPEFNALENVCIPGFFAKKSKAEVEERAKELLNILGLSDRLLHKPSELSGGEQQRVAVARALVNNPKIILADEPSGNLDSKNSEELHQLFFRLRDEFDQTFIIVTHNEKLAAMADRTCLMQDGVFV